MDKKDYLSLQSRYSFLQDYEERYRKDLKLYISDAFANYGDVFELKPEGCETWKKRSKQEDFNAMDELPYYLLIGVEDDNSHEIHISRIHQGTNDIGMQYIEVDGWDWSENEFVERWDAHCYTESLKTIADFINAVLEQELSKIRTFDKNEYVYVEGYNDESFEGVVSIDVTVDSEDDKVGIHRLVDGCALTEGEMIKAELVYQRAKGLRCPRCGGFLYHEHHDKIDNMYYCPNCKGKL